MFILHINIQKYIVDFISLIVFLEVSHFYRDPIFIIMYVIYQETCSPTNVKYKSVVYMSYYNLLQCLI